MPHYHTSFAKKILGVKYRKIAQKRVKKSDGRVGVESRGNGARGATRPTNTGGYVLFTLIRRD